MTLLAFQLSTVEGKIIKMTLNLRGFLSRASNYELPVFASLSLFPSVHYKPVENGIGNSSGNFKVSKKDYY